MNAYKHKGVVESKKINKHKRIIKESYTLGPDGRFKTYKNSKILNTYWKDLAEAVVKFVSSWPEEEQRAYEDRILKMAAQPEWWAIANEFLKPQFHHGETGPSWNDDQMDVWYALKEQIYSFKREDPVLAGRYAKKICEQLGFNKILEACK